MHKIKCKCLNTPSDKMHLCEHYVGAGIGECLLNEYDDKEIKKTAESWALRLEMDSAKRTIGNETLDFLIDVVIPLAEDEPKPGWNPTMYHTLTYEGDIKLWEKSKKTLELLKQIRN